MIENMDDVKGALTGLEGQVGTMNQRVGGVEATVAKSGTVKNGNRREHTRRRRKNNNKKDNKRH